MIVVKRYGNVWWIVDRYRKKNVEKVKYIKNLGKVTEEQAEKEFEKWKKINITPKFPLGKYDVVYADPPWRYDFSRSKSRAIESHYETLDLEDICNLKVPIDANAVLFLWATSPKLREALKVIDAWGFEYKTSMVWVKDKVGMGYYARGQHELILIAVKGEMPIPAPAKRRDSVIYAPVGEHSKKPEILYEIIESVYPQRNYLELFARNTRKGWRSWGIEL